MLLCEQVPVPCARHPGRRHGAAEPLHHRHIHHLRHACHTNIFYVIAQLYISAHPLPNVAPLAEPVPCMRHHCCLQAVGWGLRQAQG